MGRRDARRDVELIEDDDHPGVPGPAGTHRRRAGERTTPGDDAHEPGAHPDEAHTRRHRRRAAAVGAGLVTALVVAGLVGQGVVTARERDRVARLAGVANLLDPLTGPPRVLWSDAGSMADTTVRTAGDLLVGTAEGPGGEVRVQARAAATGAVAWDVELLPAGTRTDVPDDTEHVGARLGCAGMGVDVELVACLADDTLVAHVDGLQHVLAPGVVRLLLLDPQDGSVVVDLSDAVDVSRPPDSFTVVGDVVVLAGADPDSAHVRAVTREGAVAWQSTTPTATTPGRTRAWLEPVDDGMVLVTGDGVHLLTAAGTTLRSVPLGADDMIVSAVRDTVVVLAREAGRDGDTATRERTLAVRADGVVEHPGTPVPLGVDDGTGPALLTTDTGALHAWDRDGTSLWSADQRVSYGSSIVLDGRVHAASGNDLVTLDARTGEVLWRAPDLLPETALLTDGRHLLVAAPPVDGEEHPGLVALDRTDGSVVWRSPLPDVEWLAAHHGLLVAYRWDPGATESVGLATTVLG